MVSTSTPFITYDELIVDGTDLFDDAWGFSNQFPDVIDFLGKVDTEQCNGMADRLILLLRDSC